MDAKTFSKLKMADVEKMQEDIDFLKNALARALGDISAETEKRRSTELLLIHAKNQITTLRYEILSLKGLEDYGTDRRF